MAGINQAAIRQVTHIVSARELDRLEEIVILPVKYITLSADSVADVKAIQIGRLRNALDLLLVGNLLDELSCFEVHDVQAVVGLVRHEQPGVLVVDR